MKPIPILIVIFLLASFTANSQILVSMYNPHPEDNENQILQQENVYSASKWRVALDVAYSYRLGKAAEEVPSEYINRMRQGFALGVDVHGFISPVIGVGTKLSTKFYNSSYQGIKENLSTVFIGPSILCRLFDRNYKNAWIMGLSMGYLHVDDKATYNYNSLKISQGTFGMAWDLGYDIRIAKMTFLGIKLSYAAGSIKVPGNFNDQRESLSSVNMGLGLRF